MEKIKTYIVNLPQSVDRRTYMEDLMKPYTFLDVNIFNAVYGKTLSEEELSARFDKDLAFKRYGRNLEPGEIGCSLSHFSLYEKLIKSQDNYMLILEDDITILKDISRLPSLIKYIDNDTPTVLFLSGDYWYYHLRKTETDYSIASVYDAVGTYAYFVNKAAAELILEKNPKCANAADNWALFRQQGIVLKAVFPYLIDANIEDFSSEINQSHFGHIRDNMPLEIKIRSYWVALIKKIIVKQGHFVAKIRVPKCRQSQ